MKRFYLLFALVLTAALLIGCGSSNANNPFGNSPQPAVFVTGEDAPVSSVVAFNITIDKITLNNSSNTVTVMSTPTAVDFGRLVGLRSLLGFNTVPAGTYTSATFTFEAANPAPSISYLSLSANPQTPPPPSIQSATGVLSSSTVTVAFPANKPLVVGSSGLAGLHMDFDLRDSLAIDSNGNLVVNPGPPATIAINPVVTVMAVAATDDFGEITDFGGNVVSVNAAGNSFVIQGPYGFQETIDVNAATLFNGSNTLGSLAVDNIVAVQGIVQADGSILASNVEVITTDKAFISGRVLAISPGPVVSMFVGEELGTSATIPVDSIYTVNLSQVSQWDICFIDNWFTSQLFGPNSLVIGQRIFIGGVYQSNTFTPTMVSLRRQGVVGTLTGTVNITSGNQGSFQLQNDLLMSYSAGGPFTVNTTNQTVFVNVNGLTGLQTAGTANVLARGLVFYNSNTQQPVVWAHRVRVLP